MSSRIRRVLAAILAVGVGWVLVTDMTYFKSIFDLSSSGNRYLIIHTDDAGMCAAVNEATMDGLEHGVVSSASIMVVCPGYEEFARYAVANPQFDYGVHLVLTSEMPSFRWGPLLGADVPSLAQPDGTFWRTEDEVAEHAQADEVKRELQAQIHRALDRGIPISHLDHHMWVLMLRPDLLQVYVDLGREFRLPIRLSRQFVPKMCGKQLQDADEYARIIEPAVDSGFPLIDHLDAENYDVRAEKKLEYFIEAIRKLPAGVSEFVIHCSVNRPGMHLPHAPGRREADVRVFTSPEIRDEIRRKGIRVVGWKELVRLRQKSSQHQ